MWDCGRMGDVTSIFAATDEDINYGLGKRVNFGEILGKHSEIYGTLTTDDLEVLTEDQEFIDQAIKYGIIPCGYNPFDYIQDEEDSEDDAVTDELT